MAATSVRLPDDLLEGLDDLAHRQHTDRSVVLRRALEMGLRDLRLDQAIASYQEGRWTAWRCASEARVTLWELVEELRRRGLGLATDEEHLREQIEALR